MVSIKTFIITGILTGCLIQAAQAQLDNGKLLDFMQNQRYKEAVAYIKQIYPDTINDDRIISRLAYSNYMSGNLAEAEKNYNRLYHKDSLNTAILFSLANLNLKRGNVTLARDYYKKIVRLDTTNFAAYKKLADLSQILDDDHTIDYLAKANRLNPVDADAAFDYADLLSKNARQLKKDRNLMFLKADSILQTAYLADTLNVLLAKGKMDIIFRMKDYPKAMEMAKKCIRLGDASGQTINILAICYYNLKQYENCIKTYSILDQQQLANESTYYYTALSYRELGQPEKSIEYLNKSIKAGISENTSAYYEELANDNERLKRYRTTILMYQKAGEYAPNNSINYKIGRIYDAYLHDPVKAKKYYRAYVANYKSAKNEKELYEYTLNRLKDLKN